MKQLAYTFLFASSFFYFSPACAEFVMERDYSAFLQIMKKHDEKISYTRTSETERQIEATAAELARRMCSCIEWKNETECKKINDFFNAIKKSIAPDSEEAQLIQMMHFRMAAAGFDSKD